jgi:DNA primase
MIKDASVQAVLAASDIVEVVSGYTSLRKRGATFSGLCPFHQEKTPSFTVSADKGLYYCFGCSEGGDVLRFIEKMENLTFAEAVEQLAERFRVPIEYERDGQPDPAKKDRESRLLQLTDKAATFYQRYLWETQVGQAARNYLAARGLGREVCDHFRVGLSPDEWRGLHRRAAKEGFSDRELEDAGLLIRQAGKMYDRFRGRLMFPLLDHRGRVVGFGGRTLKDESPKYLNSPEGPLYRKGQLLYGLYQARRTIADADGVVVVEGYTDVLALAQAGMANVVASMGTALTDAQVGLMTRFTNNVTFMFDADRAGTEAALRSGELARSHGLRPMIAVLPSGKDPADVAVSGGQAAIEQVMAGRVSVVGFEIRQTLAQSDTASPDGRVRAFDAVRGIISKSSSPKEWDEEVQLVADQLRLSEKNVVELLTGSGAPAGAPAARGNGHGAANASETASGRATGRRPGSRGHARAGTGARAITAPPSMAERVLGREAVVEREFLVAAACNPALAAESFETLTPEHFIDPSNREAFEGLAAALRQTEGGLAHGAAKTDVPQLREHARKDSEAGRLFVRMVIEADQGRYPPSVLEELHLRLQQQALERTIARLRSQLDDKEDARAEQERLFRMQQVLQKVRASLLELDPEEG